MDHGSGQNLDKVRSICKNPEWTAVGVKKQPVMYNDSKDGKTPEHIHPDSVKRNRVMSVFAHWANRWILYIDLSKTSLHSQIVAIIFDLLGIWSVFLICNWATFRSLASYWVCQIWKSVSCWSIQHNRIVKAELNSFLQLFVAILYIFTIIFIQWNSNGMKIKAG